MAEVTISADSHARITKFKQVVDEVLEEDTAFETNLELVLARGMDFMLAELLRPEFSRALADDLVLQSFQQLALLHPGEVYGFVASALRQGRIARPPLGFAPPEDLPRDVPGDEEGQR